MAKQIFSNNSTCLLAVALGGLITDTTMYVEAGKGALFPTITGSDWFLTTLVDAAGNWEIVKVTARATDTFTIVRGQEGSTIRAFGTPGTTRVGLRPTKGTLEGLPQKAGDESITGSWSFTKTLLTAHGANVASANNMTLGGDGNVFFITGTTTINTIATKGIGTIVWLYFEGALQLTHHATDLILPTGANIVTAANDAAQFVEYATGKWRCLSYQRVNGKALVETNPQEGHLYYENQQNSGVGAPNTTTGAWNTVPLNTEVFDTGGNGAVASNQITLDAGTYRFMATCPFFNTGSSAIRLRDTTAGSTLKDGTGINTGGATNVTTRSFCFGRFTIAAGHALEIQYQCQISATTGLGQAVGGIFAVGHEVYATIELWKEF